MISVHQVGERIDLELYVQPGARRNAIVGEHNGRLKVAVVQVAEGGKANQAVIELLSKEWSLSKSSFEILRGHTHRQKTVAITGVTIEQITSLLPQSEVP